MKKLLIFIIVIASLTGASVIHSTYTVVKNFDMASIKEDLETIYAKSTEGADSYAVMELFEDASPAQEPVTTSIESNLVEERNGNAPFFKDEEITTEAFEYYAPLDSFGRCGPATVCAGPETLPTEERGEIGHVKPTGWNQNKYPDIIPEDPSYVYNRCHLVAYEISAENDNICNLITGTRAMNLAMLPYENEIAWYIKDTGNHVMYRVTPIFENDNMLASGVLMEAYSVEDNGEGIQFCIFVRNEQPGIEIDYQTGENWAS